MTENALRHELVRNPILPDADGVLTVGEAPGFGLELKPEVLQKYRVD